MESGEIHHLATELAKGLKRIVYGQEEVIEQLITCLFAGGHVLIEGVPGLGKTLLARALSTLIDAKYKRIQFTPDLLPSDIIGTMVFNPQAGTFSFHRGPVFTEVLLGDEINRTPPKSQAALLEAMEEKQVTVNGVKKPLAELFFVIATQNPIEYEGTYPLPETQLDRFMMRIQILYPSENSEMNIIRSYSEGQDLHQVETFISKPVISKDQLLDARKSLNSIILKPEVAQYLHKIILETRNPEYTFLGASTRSAIALLKSARALAAIRGSEFVTPEEIKDLSLPVLRHRVILRSEALVDGLTADIYLQNILSRVPVPR